MKKLTIMMLVTALTVSLCACGEKSVQGEVIPVSSEMSTEVSTEQSLEESSEQSTEESSVEESSEEKSSSVEEASENAEVQLAETTGNTYLSNWAGVKIEFDDNWYVATEEDLAQLSGIVDEYITDEKMKAQLETAGVVYDLFAQNQLDGSSINVNFQKINSVFGAIITEEQMVDATFEEYEDVLYQSGYETITTMEKRTRTIAGQEHFILYSEGTAGEVSVQMIQFMIVKDSYIWCATAVCVPEYTDGKTVEDIVDMFEAIN